MVTWIPRRLLIRDLPVKRTFERSVNGLRGWRLSLRALSNGSLKSGHAFVELLNSLGEDVKALTDRPGVIGGGLCRVGALADEDPLPLLSFHQALST